MVRYVSAGYRWSRESQPNVGILEKEWKEIGDKVEVKVMRKLKQWADDEEGSDSGRDWEEIGDKVEKKLKEKIQIQLIINLLIPKIS